jgi:hypothetical protein
LARGSATIRSPRTVGDRHAVLHPSTIEDRIARLERMGAARSSVLVTA